MTDRQRHSRPSLRTGGPALTFAPRRTGRRRLVVLGLVAVFSVVAVRDLGDAAPTDTPDGVSIGAGGAQGAAAADSTTDRLQTAATADSGVAVDAPIPPDTSDTLATPEATETDTTPGTAALATVGGVELYVPADESLLVAYHEASMQGVLGMEPIGQLLDNANPTRIDPPPDDPDGLPYVILSSRGRVFPPTSAVDVVLRDDQRVLAPVTGTVVEVRGYDLYGRYADTRIELEPDGAPNRRVVIIHVTGPQVAPGDRVIAGRTPIAASPTQFPFSSHVDRYLEPERHPHVHLEVKDPSLTVAAP